MSNKRKHKTLTLKDKLAIINMLDNGDSMGDIATQFGIGRSTIYDIKVRRSKIIQHVNLSNDRKTLRFGKFPQLDTALYNWFLEERALNNPVTGDLLKEKSKEIYFNLTGQEFKASSGWLDKFKKRFGIKFNASGASGEKSSFRCQDEDVIAEFVKGFREKVEQLCLLPDQLYCADASGLLCRVLEQKLVFKEEGKPKKICKDSITFIPCSNATGTHKLDLLVIGKETTEEFKDTTLPVCYKNQMNGWMTRELFTEWFHDEFVPNVRSFMALNNLPEKALLVLDEAPGYPEEYYLKSNDWMIQAMFIPPDYSQLIQPMDRNLMQAIKSRYKKKLLLDVISKGGDVKQNVRDLNLQTIMFALVDSWNSLSSNIIRNSWKKLCPNIDITNETDDDGIPVDHLLAAFRGSDIDEKDVSNWLAGNIDEIPDVANEDIYNETIVLSIKPEDPLTVQKPINSSDLGLSDDISITVPSKPIKTENLQDT